MRDRTDLIPGVVARRVTIAERSRRRVAEAIDRLQETHSGFETVEKTWHHPPEAYDRIVERFEAGTVGGAGAWTAREDGAVLLVRKEGETAWSDPGGKQEPGERLEAPARREVREETGVAVELTGVRQTHRIEVRDAERARPPISRLIVIFDAEPVAGDPRPRPGEIAAVRWWRERPDELLYPELAEYPIPAAGR
ncbi:ADP-ribose pyrophosphatase [Halobacteriales archaeon QS_1_67_19]|nr:MAG: ADP-ribose pyrophosphatase [Halobacteriales archaeon QS_1_67_19]